MRKRLEWMKPELALAGIGVLVAGVLLIATLGVAVPASSAGKKDMQKSAYTVYQQKCLGCHDSIADPEKPGRTRDDWHLVVEVMHGYGLDLTAAESDMIVDLLYHLRKGMEREAG